MNSYDYDITITETGIFRKRYQYQYTADYTVNGHIFTRKSLVTGKYDSELEAIQAAQKALDEFNTYLETHENGIYQEII